MIKLGILVSCFLAATGLTSESKAQASDVANLLYKVNKALLLQERKVKKAYNALLSAHEDYVEDPNPTTYQALVVASQEDTQAIQDYGQLVANAKKIEAQIEKAETTFYEETPATKAEIEKGPEGKGTPPGGESVASEMNETKEEIVGQVEKEIEENEGGESPFAAALRKQAANLKAVKDRITQEQKTPAVTENPTAQSQDQTIKNQLSNAIDARMEAIFCTQQSLKRCCSKYPNNPNCTEK